ncbi:MAG TPA: GlsB/YeaQ/YmgE family stress response membrane protein [Actinomycetes bacterium]|nr:GlsB/YeaQ/YmgE family stress response membrane protein [Actinomycetes bacterium]
MTVSGIISAIVIGAIVGILGRLVLPGRQPIGVLLTLVIGIIAALVGTWIAQQIGVDTTDGVDWIEIIFQVGLAALAIAAVAGFRGRSRVP